MSPTVHEIRNAIRVTTGRFEREIAASFTKEELQAIAKTLGDDADEGDRSSTTEMRRHIRAQVGVAESLEMADESTFRKTELQAIADVLEASVEP